MGGVLLEHEHSGAHPDDKGNTVDPQLELKNFEHTGKILGRIWSGMVIDGYSVIAKYIGDKRSEFVNDVSDKLRLSRIRLSQYLLQIVKCNIIACCMPLRLSCKNFVKDRFLPPSFGMSQSLDNGFKWTSSVKTSQDLSLQQTVAMSSVIPTFVQWKYSLGISYNVFNPAVKDNLKKTHVFSLQDVFWHGQNDVEPSPVL